LHGKDLHFNLFEVLEFSGDVKLSPDHSDYRWLSKEEILKLETMPYILSYLENN